MSAAPNRIDIFGTFLRGMAEAEAREQMQTKALGSAATAYDPAAAEMALLRLLDSAAPHDLKHLMEASALPPSHLAATLAQLQQSAMIMRDDEGCYALTELGREFAAAAV